MLRTRWMLVGVVLAVVAGTAAFADKEKEKKEEGVIDPKADAQLKKMSEYLAGLKSFKVDAVAVDEKITTEGQKIQQVMQEKISLLRPGSLRIERNGPNGRATLAANGKQVVVVNHDKNVYAQEKAPATIDGLVDELREKLQVDAPGADFIIAKPYDELIEGLQVGHYIGLEPIGDVMAHHLAVTEKDVDWQVWIQDGAEPVPLRFVITSKDMKNHPQFTLEMSDWQPAARLTPDTFQLTPPPNAKRIERSPRAER